LNKAAFLVGRKKEERRKKKEYSFSLLLSPFSRLEFEWYNLIKQFSYSYFRIFSYIRMLP